MTRTDHRGLRFLQEPADRVADYRDRGGLDRFEHTPVDGPRSHRIEVVGLHYLGRHDPGLASDPYLSGRVKPGQYDQLVILAVMTSAAL